MSAPRIELLINGHSRRSLELIRQIGIICKQEGLVFDRENIVKGSELDDTLRQIKRRAPDLLVVGGGDGTISDVVDYLAGTNIELGIIPLGTTNNFARSLALPLTLPEAIHVIATGTAQAIDLGRIKNEYFANVAGIGLSAVIAGSVSDKNKRRFGRAAYGLEGIWQLIKHKPFVLTLEDKDRELQLNLETHQIIIANGRFHAGRQIAVDASLTSRELLIFSLGGRSKISFIIAMFDFYLGKRKSIRHSSYLIGRDVLIKTSTTQPVELDGEVKFSTPFGVAVEADAVKVRVA